MYGGNYDYGSTKVTYKAWSVWTLSRILWLSDAYMLQQTNHHWFRLTSVKPLSAAMWNIVNWTFRNKLQWYFNQNPCIFIEKNSFENVAWKMAAILSRSQCVNQHERKRLSSPASIFPDMVNPISLRMCPLTRWVWDKMAAIIQTTFSSAFFVNEIFWI